MEIFEKWKRFVSDMNSKGIPLPMARDPKTGKGSITATSYWIALNLCIFCSLMFIVSVVARLTGTFAPEAETQAAIQNAATYSLQLFLACGGFYLGRKLQGDGKGNLSVEEKKIDPKEIKE